MPALVQPSSETIPAAKMANSPANAPPPTLWVSIAKNHEALAEHRAAWDDLALHAAEPNVHYESWMLLPAAQMLAAGKDLIFVLVYRADPRNPKQPILCGFFPLERKRGYRRLPVGSLSLWNYGPCEITTPLVRKTDAAETWTAFFDWLAKDPESRGLIEFEQLPADGPIYQGMIDEMRRRGTFYLVNESWTRALLRRRESAEAYLQEALSSNKRRDLQRKERRLREQGKLEYITLQPTDDVEPWLEHFLRLEACGWKGQIGTALACKNPDREYFLTMAREAFRLGKLWMVGLALNDQPIALRCNFNAPPGSFFFKPGYDEAYSRFSPGVLVELENIRQFHANPALGWMDSCTSPDNTMLNSLWLDRRIMVSLLAATGRRFGGLALSVLPLMRWLKRAVRRTR